MKYCQEYAALLDLYVDGELNADDMIRVQAHLNECPSCQSYVDDALAIRAAFPDVDDTIVPDGFAESILEKMQATAVCKPKKKSPWAKIALPLAACCAIVLLLQNGPVLFSAKTEEAASEPKTAAPTAAMDTCLDTTAETTEEATTESSIVEYAEPVEGVPRISEDNVEVECEALAETGTHAVVSKTSDAVYATTVFLPTECADLLKDYAPLEETAAEAHYALTSAEYESLLVQLESAEFSYTSEDSMDSSTNLVLVILSK